MSNTASPERTDKYDIVTKEVRKLRQVGKSIYIYFNKCKYITIDVRRNICRVS